MAAAMCLRYMSIPSFWRYKALLYPFIENHTTAQGKYRNCIPFDFKILRILFPVVVRVS